jgi:hypothetical protein
MQGYESLVKSLVESQVITQVDTALHKEEEKYENRNIFLDVDSPCKERRTFSHHGSCTRCTRSPRCKVPEMPLRW